MTEARFDEIVHAPQRLRILAMLDAISGRVEFAALRDALGVADSVVSKHLKVLADAGYVSVTKAAALGRQRTWVTLTPTGEDAYAAHVAALRDITAGHPRVDGPV
ncbi:MarR family transcriptional regulator [Microbacterium mangrovi]|uniref:MarR family transcriptional regulator n=1 Tax=Microbacterium mangrovi TaxID=1348253 RepID=A0A0B2A8M8_9MICO|nr:transcriptional regulator [Microbacterium mangrovi]KHK97991.1 MarR family transcriptional regulator [Microbacterium mangrovi]